MNTKKALSSLKGLKGKIPKKGTNEYEIFIYFIQIIEGATAVLLTRLGVNAATKEAWMKEVLTWSISIILFIPCFFKFPGVGHVKAIAYGVFMEAINRSVMKRLEKTNFGLKYLAGDEIPVSEREMEALVERRLEEERIKNNNVLNGNDYPQEEGYIEGDEIEYVEGEEIEYVEGDEIEYVEGDEVEVHNRIIPMAI